jgi:TonB family protein
MTPLFIYLLKSSCYLVICFIAYSLLFKKETFYQINRIVLLCSFLLALLLPLLHLPFVSPLDYLFNSFITTEKSSVSVMVDSSKVITNSINSQAIVTTSTSWWSKIMDHPELLLVGIYLIIAGLLLLVHLWQLCRIYLMIKQGNITQESPYRYVQSDKFPVPFSFFHYIFLPTIAYEQTTLQHILLHEKAHASQRHSYDILIATFYCCICWFNPAAWLMKRALQLNLEYLADEAVIQQERTTKFYQYSLLKIGLQYTPRQLVSGFSQSFIKNRIVMMNKQPSPNNKKWKYWLSLPVALLSLSLLSANTTTNADNVSGPSKYIASNSNYLYAVITPKTSETDLENMKSSFAAKKSNLVLNNITRNSKGYITSIDLELSDKRGSVAISSNDDYNMGIDCLGLYTGINTSEVGTGALTHLFTKNKTPFPKELLTVAKKESVNKPKDKNASNKDHKGSSNLSAGGSNDSGGSINTIPHAIRTFSNDSLSLFLSKHIRYPRNAQVNGIAGVAEVSFTVSPDGSVSNLKILNAPEKMMGEELKRVIGSIPPDYLKGKSVAEERRIAAKFMLYNENDSKIDAAPDFKADIIVVGYQPKKK